MNKVHPNQTQPTANEQIPKEQLRNFTPRANRRQVSILKRNGILKLKQGEVIEELKKNRLLGMHLTAIAPFKLLTSAQISTIDAKMAEKMDIRAKFEIYSLAIRYTGPMPKMISKLCPEYQFLKDSNLGDINNMLLKGLEKSFIKAEKFIFDDKNWIDELKKIPEFFKENPENYYEMYFPKRIKTFASNSNLGLSKWFFEELFLTWDLKKTSEQELTSQFEALKKLSKEYQPHFGLKGVIVCLAFKILLHLANIQETTLEWPKRGEHNKIDDVKPLFSGLKIDDLIQKKYSLMELRQISYIQDSSLFDQIHQKVASGVTEPNLVHNLLIQAGGHHDCLLNAVNQKKKIPIDCLISLKKEAQKHQENAGKYSTIRKELKGKGQYQRNLEFEKEFLDRKWQMKVKGSTEAIIDWMILMNYNEDSGSHEKILQNVNPSKLKEFVLSGFYLSEGVFNLLIKLIEKEAKGKTCLFVRKAFTVLGNQWNYKPEENFVLKVFEKCQDKATILKMLFFRQGKGMKKSTSVSGLLKGQKSFIFFSQEGNSFKQNKVTLSFDVPKTNLLLRFYRNTQFMEACFQQAPDPRIKSALDIIMKINSLIQMKDQTKARMEIIEYFIEKGESLVNDLKKTNPKVRRMFNIGTVSNSFSFPYSSIQGCFDKSQISSKGNILLKILSKTEMKQIYSNISSMKFLEKMETGSSYIQP